MGWEALVTGSLDIQVLPGDHYNIIKEPQVKELAIAIGRLTEEAEQSHSRSASVDHR